MALAPVALAAAMKMALAAVAEKAHAGRWKPKQEHGQAAAPIGMSLRLYGHGFRPCGGSLSGADSGSNRKL